MKHPGERDDEDARPEEDEVADEGAAGAGGGLDLSELERQAKELLGDLPPAPPHLLEAVNRQAEELRRLDEHRDAMDSLARAALEPARREADRAAREERQLEVAEEALELTREARQAALASKDDAAAAKEDARRARRLQAALVVIAALSFLANLAMFVWNLRNR